MTHARWATTMHRTTAFPRSRGRPPACIHKSHHTTHRNANQHPARNPGSAPLTCSRVPVCAGACPPSTRHSHPTWQQPRSAVACHRLVPQAGAPHSISICCCIWSHNAALIVTVRDRYPKVASVFQQRADRARASKKRLLLQTPCPKD